MMTESVVEFSVSSALERKRPAIADHRLDTHHSWGAQTLYDSGVVLVDKETEVVGIKEDVHLFRMVGAAVAKFIGTDSFEQKLPATVDHHQGAHHPRVARVLQQVAGFVGAKDDTTVIGITKDYSQYARECGRIHWFEFAGKKASR